MRTTIRLDPDVLSAAERVRRERSIGLGEAVNELVRIGLASADRQRTPYRQRTQSLGARIDVSNVAEALELLEEEPRR